MILVLVSDLDTRFKIKVIGLWQFGKHVHQFLATIEKVVKRFQRPDQWETVLMEYTRCTKSPALI